MVASQVITQVAFSLALPFLPLYIRQLGVASPSGAALWAGIAATASGLAMALVSPLWGRLADRFGRKAMVLRATFAGVFVVGAMGLVQQPLPLVLLRLLQGGLTGTVSAANTLVASVVPGEQLGFSMGLMQTAVLAGVAGGPLIGGAIADAYGYRAAFALTAALLFGAGALVLFGARERRRTRAPEAAGPPAPPNRRALRPVIVVSFLDQFANSIVGPVLPLFVGALSGNVGRGTSTLTGMVLGAFALSASVGALLAGRLADRFTPRAVLVTCAAGAAVFAAGQALAPSVLALGLLRAGMGLFIGGTIPAANVILGQLTRPESRGAAFGLTASATALGFAAGPLVGALLLRAGDRAPFVLTALCLAAEAVWVYRQLPPGRPAPVQSAPDEPEREEVLG